MLNVNNYYVFDNKLLKTCSMNYIKRYSWLISRCMIRYSRPYNYRLISNYIIKSNQIIHLFLDIEFTSA